MYNDGYRVQQRNLVVGTCLVVLVVSSLSNQRSQVNLADFLDHSASTSSCEDMSLITLIK